MAMVLLTLLKKDLYLTHLGGPGLDCSFRILYLHILDILQIYVDVSYNFISEMSWHKI